MQWLTQYSNRIEGELRRTNFPDNPARLYEPLDYFLGIGGKRIRPVLTMLAAELFGNDPEEVLPQAVALELFHNFTLIHDDIMDQAPLRRNNPTLHTKYGLSTAILSGDVLLVKAYQELCKTDTDLLGEVLDLFNRTAVEVCEGQQLDMDFEERSDVSVADYLEMIRLKTSVLLGCSLKMGAILSGAKTKDAELLYGFGVNIGLAFQIRDDILDLYGTAEAVGKQNGGDILSDKKTILYLTALSNATAGQLEALKLLTLEAGSERKVKRAKELFDELDIERKCRDYMNDHYSKALLALKQIDVPDDRKAKLRELAVFLIERDH